MNTNELLDAVLARRPATSEAAVRIAIEVDEECYHLIAAQQSRKGFWGLLNRRRGTLTRDIVVADAFAASGQARMFDPGEADVTKLIRTELIDPDTSKPIQVGPLAGERAAKVLRRVAERDITPALTTVNRCKLYLRLADHVESETERTGRDVSVAEVLGWAA